MRTWAAAYCPNAPWWHCVVDGRPASFDWGMADQLVYSELLAASPYLWRPLPCGLHADTQVLQGVALRADCAGRLGLFPFRGKPREYWAATWGARADGCESDGRGPERAARRQRPLVAFTHAAAGSGDLARKLAATLAAHRPEDECPSRLDLLESQARSTQERLARAERRATYEWAAMALLFVLYVLRVRSGG